MNREEVEKLFDKFKLEYMINSYDVQFTKLQIDLLLDIKEAIEKLGGKK